MKSLFALTLGVLLALAWSGLRRSRSWGATTTGATLVLCGGLGAALVLGRGPFGVFALADVVLFLALPAYGAGVALLARRGSRLRRSAAALSFGLAAIGAWSHWVEPRWLEVTRTEIRSPWVAERVRIAVVADLQTDRIGAYERRVFETLRRETPDLVLLPGDYLHVGPEHRAALTAELRDLLVALDPAPRLGAFAVGGDVDPPGWDEIFRGTWVRALGTTTTVDLQALTLTALEPGDSRRAPAIPEVDRFHVVVGHAPDFALRDPPGDLWIAGHTHGGQVRLPLIGPLLTLSQVPRSWAAGRTDLPNGKTLIVSRGVGMERGRAPRVRFLCRPELAIIDLVPEREPPPQQNAAGR